MIGPTRSRGQISERSLNKRLALPGYLDELSGQPWRWGSIDCTMCVGAWIERIIGVDPLREFRGRYHTADEARETVKAAGGFLPALGFLFDAAGLARTAEFEDGDVAAVEAGVHERFVLPVVGAILAIRSGSLWVAKAHRGIVARDFRVIHGWRV